MPPRLVSRVKEILLLTLLLAFASQTFAQAGGPIVLRDDQWKPIENSEFALLGSEKKHGNQSFVRLPPASKRNGGETFAITSSANLPEAVPGVPFSIFAQAGDRQATVYFGSGNDGGSPITSYTVRSNPGAVTVTGIASPIVVSGLTNGTAYSFTVFATNAQGSGPATAPSNLVTPNPADPLALRDDRFEFRENEGLRGLHVMANDSFAPSKVYGGSLTLLTPPIYGTAVIGHTLAPAIASGDIVFYTPKTDFSGEDRFSYRICESGGLCADAQITVLVRPMIGSIIFAGSHTGMMELPGTGLRALPSARFKVSRLVAPSISSLGLSTDSWRFTPWDNGLEGTAYVSGVIPAPSDGQPRQWRLLINASASGTRGAGDLDLYVGTDAFGTPAQNEVQCVSAMDAYGNERCEIVVTHPGIGTVSYWAMVHNQSFNPIVGLIETFLFPEDSSDGGFYVTGPGKLQAGEDFDLRAVYDDPTMLRGDTRAAYVSLESSDGENLGAFPVVIYRWQNTNAAMWLRDGEVHSMALDEYESQNRVVFDVPQKASSVVFSLSAPNGVQLYLAHDPNPSGPNIDPAPERQLAQHVLTAGVNNSVTLSGASLLPGRWYVTPVNPFGTKVNLSLNVESQSQNSIADITPGHYYNPDRSGHGVFIDHARDEWFMMWYTYLEDGSPVWYISDPQPRSATSWSASLRRVSWDGVQTHSVVVGEVTVNGQGIDPVSGVETFSFNYTIDGFAGSERMYRLGSAGCVANSGQNLDVSGHWFSPSKSGFGYSVQIDAPSIQELVAAYVYDEKGYARWLYGQAPLSLPGVGMDLYQLTGSCPSCSYLPSTAQRVGVFSRNYGLNTIERAGVDAIMAGAAAGVWSEDRPVSPLSAAPQCR